MTDNITAAAFTRAAQIAVRELKQKLRDQGRRHSEIRISDRARAIAQHLAANPRILERARADIERWRSKFTTKEKSRRR